MSNRNKLDGINSSKLVENIYLFWFYNYICLKPLKTVQIGKLEVYLFINASRFFPKQSRDNECLG